MNLLQLSEMVFAINTRIQPYDTGSLLSRFFGRDVRGSLPNSLNRNLNWSFLIVNLPNEDEVAGETVMNADERVVEAGQDTERGDVPGQRPLRRSARL